MIQNIPEDEPLICRKFTVFNPPTHSVLAKSDEILGGLSLLTTYLISYHLEQIFYTELAPDTKMTKTAQGGESLDAKMSAKELASYEWGGMLDYKCRAL